MSPGPNQVSVYPLRFASLKVLFIRVTIESKIAAEVTIRSQTDGKSPEKSYNQGPGAFSREIPLHRTTQEVSFPRKLQSTKLITSKMQGGI